MRAFADVIADTACNGSCIAGMQAIHGIADNCSCVVGIQAIHGHKKTGVLADAGRFTPARLDRDQNL